MRPLTDHTARLLAPVRGIDSYDRLRLGLTREGDSFIARLYALDPYGSPPHAGNGHQPATRFPTQAASKLFVSRILEKQELRFHENSPGNYYQFAATDITAAIIHHVWPREQIEFATDDARLIFYGLVAQAVEQERNAELIAQYKEYQAVNLKYRAQDLDVSEAAGYSPQLFKYALYDQNPELPLALYQQVGLRCCATSQGFALFMEQGTGKTPIIISLICNEARERDNKNMLIAFIACPKNVRSNWASEFQRFATEPGKITVLRGGKLDRMKQILDAIRVEKDVECNYSVIISSYETAKKTWDVLGGVKQYDIAALDEAHAIKSPKAERSQWAMKLRDKALRRYVLTGSPVANTPLDIYMQLEFLGRGWSGFNSWQKFKAFYGVFEQHGGGLVGFQNLAFMRERLARVSYIVTKKEVLPDLPPVTYDIDEVEMTPEQWAAYRDVAQKLYLEAEKELEDNTIPRSMRVQNILTKFLRLAQITSGFIAWDKVHSDTGELLQPTTYDRFDPDPKLERVVELLKEKGPNDKTIIWSCWVPNIRTIRARLQLENIGAVAYYGQTKDVDRDAAVHAFNHDTNCKVFIGNPGAGGVGLNLIGYPPGDESIDTNCNHEIFFSQGWSYIHRTQAEARAHRRGTREPLRITDLQVSNTIDEEIRDRVTSKRTMATTIADVREILNSVLSKIKIGVELE